MTILFVDQFGQLGGAQRCLLDLLPAFQQHGWKFHLAVPEDGPFPGQVRSLGIETTILPRCTLSSIHKSLPDTFRYLNWYPRASQALYRLTTEIDPALIYVNGPRLLPPAALCATRLRKPLIFHAHNRLLQTTALWSLAVHLRLAGARVVACCRYVANGLRPSVPNTSIEVVYNGVPDVQMSPHKRTSPFPLIGVIGRIEPEKGHLDFVRAAHLVHCEYPHARFAIVGAPLFSNADTYLQQTLSESHNLPITFTGWRADIPRVLNQLDVLVVPSSAHDATPRVILEAFSAGTPVLAFRSGGITELIENNRTGFLVDTRSPEALAERILDILGADETLLPQIAYRARQRWASDFRLELYQKRISDIIARRFP